jgi:hypothetical protein
VAERRTIWLVTCSCGWGREVISAWAATVVSRQHQQFADVGTEHVTRVEVPDQHRAGEQLMLD